MIAASHQGFSVHINATCDETPYSSKLCDVAVAFSVMLKWRTYNKGNYFMYKKDHFEVVSLEENPSRRYFFNFYERSRTDVVSGIPLNLSHLVYGNWRDALEYCQAKELHLSTLTPSLMEQLKYTFNIKYPEHGWNDKDAYIFAGLHRNNVVSIL